MSEFIREPPPTPPVEPVHIEPRPNPLTRIIGVFVLPVETFASIARRPDWIVPLLLIVIVSVASTAVITPRMDIEGMLRDQMEGRKDVSQEQIDMAVKLATKFQGVSAAFSIVGVPISVLAVTGIYFIALQMFAGEARFTQILSATAYGWLPMLIRSILVTALIIPRAHIRPEKVAAILKSNVAAFVPVSDNPALLTLLSSIDAFYIWSLILLIIGYTAASKLKRGTVAAIVLSVWILAVLVFSGLAGLGSLMKG